MDMIRHAKLIDGPTQHVRKGEGVGASGKPYSESNSVPSQSRRSLDPVQMPF
jgi:hypothetical protein